MTFSNTPFVFATAVAACTLIGGMAVACPIASDLQRGIQLNFTDGTQEVYTSMKEGLVRAVGGNPGDDQYQLDLAYGVYLLVSQDIIDGQPDFGSRLTTAFPMSIAQMPIPQAGARWQADVTLTDADGTSPETQTFAMGGPRTQIIGDCSYEAIDIMVHYDGAEQLVDGLVLLPELGFAYLSWFEDNDGARSDYPVASISAR
ncbi:hypothetical protein [Aestuariibius sp. HNIBRBA575]|uniref:hypothetical protein n=1 Tax=Aestuariibius sp. HNIBRBA575 TaxID=3233343 RepID=UPI0034A15F63